MPKFYGECENTHFGVWSVGCDKNHQGRHRPGRTDKIASAFSKNWKKIIGKHKEQSAKKSPEQINGEQSLFRKKIQHKLPKPIQPKHIEQNMKEAKMQKTVRNQRPRMD